MQPDANSCSFICGMFAWRTGYKKRFSATGVCFHCCSPCAYRRLRFRTEYILDGMVRCDVFACLAIPYVWWSDCNAEDERDALDGGFNLRQLFPRDVFCDLCLHQSRYELSVCKRVNDLRVAVVRGGRIPVDQRADNKIHGAEKLRGVEVAEVIVFANRVAVLHRSVDCPERLRNHLSGRVLHIVWILHIRNFSVLFPFARHIIARRRRKWLQTCKMS